MAYSGYYSYVKIEGFFIWVSRLTHTKVQVLMDLGILSLPQHTKTLCKMHSFPTQGKSKNYMCQKENCDSPAQ